MPTQFASIVVANLETTERYFHLFEVECYDSGRTTLIAGPFTAAGEWDGTSKWKQKDPIFFRGLTLGTTYSFRSRVLTQAGGPASAWSAWVDETAGDTTAPNPSYSATARKSGGAVLVDSAPSSAPSDLDHYEFHFNLTNTSPSSSTAPNLPNSPDGKVVIATDPDDTIYLWVRAVDTSGNRQAWTSLGSLNVGTLENANDGSTRFARTASHSSYRPTTNPLTATDAGATATVSIAAFVNRLYENSGHTDVSYNSGSITSLSFATTYFIDMSDSALAGGTVTFNARTTRESVRGFFIGSITTPVDGGGDTVGNNDGGAGAQIPQLNQTFLSGDAGERPYFQGQRYHASAFRAPVTTARSGGTSAGSFTTVASFPLTLPPGSALYKGNLSASVSGGTPAVKSSNSGSASNVAGAGTDWSNPSQALGDDALYAVASLPGGGSSDDLRIDFDFSASPIPSGATLKGFRLSIKRVVIGAGQGQDSKVQLHKSGTANGSNKSAGTNWPSTEGTIVFGSNNDLWSTSGITVADLNNGIVGCLLAATNADPTNSESCQINNVTFEVFYDDFIAEARIKIGSQVSGLVTVTGPATSAGPTEVTVNNPGSGAVTVEVQGRFARGGGTVTPSFDQIQYTDQNESQVG